MPEQPLSGQSPAELATTSCCLIWDSTNLEGQVAVFMSPRNRVAQLYSRALGSLFVVHYDSQSQGGGVFMLLVLISVRCWVNPRPSEAWRIKYIWKFISLGLEPTTFRPVA
jgi:hypothetical protein